MSKIIKVTTIRIQERPNIIWVELETDEGLTGLGEVFRGTTAVEAVIHTDIALGLIGQDSRQIEKISRMLTTPYIGFHSAGAEIRAASAIDIALWDLYGQRHDIPVYEALGGAARDTVPVYNTCAGYAFNTSASTVNSGASRRLIGTGDEMRGPYDDQIAFMRDAGELAESLLEEGYKGMKIWPFDGYAVKTNGNTISLVDLAKGLEPFQKIREKVGNKIEIMCELHSLWNLPAALRICRALEEYDVLWVEDPLCKMDDADTLHYLRSKTNAPICGSETLASPVTFRQMMSTGTFDYIMLDVGWCGGLTEGRKISAIAESYGLPISPHDCTGPIALWTAIQLSFHSSATLYQEVVRANLATWYKELVADLPEIKEGELTMPKRPGIGTHLLPQVKEREDAIIRVTR